LTQQSVFNALTNNGQTQGIYLSGGKIYINASYIKSGEIDSDMIDLHDLMRIYYTKNGRERFGGYIGAEQSYAYGYDETVGIFSKAQESFVGVTTSEAQIVSDDTVNIQGDEIYIGFSSEFVRTSLIAIGSANQNTSINLYGSITMNGYAGYNGTITVDGKSYRVRNGIITRN